MKKNISINLFGTLYNIDEDAYNLLENYLQSMQRYFSRQEGGEEIADDIEHRVAELLWERREAGMTAVSIEVIKEIIDTIGNAEQIDDSSADFNADAAEGSAADGGPKEGGAADGTAGEAPFRERFSQFSHEAGRFTRDAYDRGCRHVSTHHFYRRVDDKLLGGVCSGMVPYFECGDSLMWRLGTILMTILLSVFGIGFLIPILYIALWVLAPKALTPEDRLRMQGKDITPENLTQQVMDEAQQPYVQPTGNTNNGCLKVLLILLGVIFLFPLIGALLALVLTLVMVGGAGSVLVGGLFSGLHFWPSFAGCVTAAQPLLITTLVCCLLVVGLPIYGLLRLIRSTRRMRTSVIIGLLLLWLLAFGAGIGCIVASVAHVTEWQEGNERLLDYNGSLRKMMSVGWTLEENKNLDVDFAESRTGYGGLPRYAFILEAEDDDQGYYSAHFEKEVSLSESGSYRFQSLTEGNDPGLTFTFHYTDNGEEKFVTLKPALDGTQLRSIPWEVARSSAIFPAEPDSTGWQQFSQEGEDWVCHTEDIAHVDSGLHTIIISAKDCIEPMKIRDLRVVRLQ